MSNSMLSFKKLSTEDRKMLNSIFWRSLMVFAGPCGAAYRQAPGFTNSIMPALVRYYPEKEKLAEAIECSPRYIGDIEQDRSKPSYEVLVKMCNLFNIGLDEIFSEYLEVKGKKEINSALFGFDKLKPNNQDTIIHMIEYFNKSNVS